MLQSPIFIALLQGAAGDPAAPAAPAAQPAPVAGDVTTEAAPAPRTERRRVCMEYPPSTGGRLPLRRCRWQEVVVEETAPDAVADSEQQGGGGSRAVLPAPQ